LFDVVNELFCRIYLLFLDGECTYCCSSSSFPCCSEDDEHAKAHFRRAIARYNLGQEDAAKKDFDIVKRLDPAAVPDVERELARMAARDKAAAQKQRQEWGSFFEK
jgi:hypothetical protein